MPEYRSRPRRSQEIVYGIPDIRPKIRLLSSASTRSRFGTIPPVVTANVEAGDVIVLLGNTPQFDDIESYSRPRSRPARRSLDASRCTVDNPRLVDGDSRHPGRCCRQEDSRPTGGRRRPGSPNCPGRYGSSDRLPTPRPNFSRIASVGGRRPEEPGDELL